VKKDNVKADFKGYFNSIWKKDKDGRWKVLIDLGIPSPFSEYDEQKVEYVSSSIDQSAGFRDQIARPKTADSLPDISIMEEKFIADYADGKGYMKYASPKARVFRPGKRVMKGGIVSPDSSKHTFRYAGGAVASSADLGYAYGYVTAPGKEGNYLRVWKKENNAWKIVLDVQTF
jgi:ketosteroid isomerase-like protein